MALADDEGESPAASKFVAAGHCDRCKRPASVRVQIEPWAYVCASCLDVEEAERE